MSFLFKKRKSDTAVHPVVWELLAKQISLIQGRWAEYLQMRSQKLSTLSLYIWFTVFCLVFTSACLYTISQALGPHPSAIRVMPISVPRYIVPAPGMNKPINPGSEYEHIVAFKKYLDSLILHAKPAYDSIQAVRPGLIDSLNQVILLHQQLKGG